MFLIISILIFIPRNLYNATLTEVLGFFPNSINVPNTMKLNNVLWGEIAFQGPVGSKEQGRQGFIWGNSLCLASDPPPKAATLGYKEITDESLP